MLKHQDKKEATLENLLLMGEVLNDYKVGLSNFTATVPYQRLYRRVRILQEQLPNLESSNKVNDFFSWSEGFYCLLISTKPLMGESELMQVIPTKVKAQSKLMHRWVENNTANLITAVRESMTKAKEKGSEEKHKK